MKKTIALIISSLLWLTAWSARAQETQDPDWKGGTVNLRMSSWPKSLNAITSGDGYSRMIWYHTLVTMLNTDEKTWDPVPFLAKKWEISKDNRTFTFYLDETATWEDGKPITAEDVKFSFDLMYDPKRCVLCEPIRGFYGPLEYVKVVNPHQVEIRTGDVHFDKLARIGSLYVLPKHKYEKGNFDKDYDKVIYGGGPYVYDEGESKYRKKVVLKRRKNHWTNKYEYYRQRFNFDKIIYNYVEDPVVAFELFKRKQLDYFYIDQESYDFLENRNANPFTEKNFGLVQAPKYYPSYWMGIAINMREGIGKDKRVRNALQYLLNYDEINTKVFKGHMTPISGPFNKGSKYSAKVPPKKFDIEKAKALLKEAGFTKAGPDGYLFREIQENGKTVQQKASFTVLYANLRHEKWMTMYKEDAKKAGFEIIPRYMDWSAMQKLMDEYKFEALVMSWGGDIIPGPEQLFHGRSIDNKGGSNYPGINHARLNELIEKGPAEFNEPKRLKMYHEMEKILIDENPYVYRWQEANHYVIYWKDKLDPTATPFYQFSGNETRRPFHFHWRAVKN